MSMAGKSIGPYQILDKLGEGGMGEVYRARDTRLNRDVAIKVLPAHLTNDPDRVARFEREAQALAALNHQNIAQIYGVEEHALVMEFVPGQTLEEQIRTSKLDAPVAVRIARSIAEALETAHAAGIIHRDLKPANVKVRDDGVVKVLDFGLAKAAAPEGPFLGSGATVTSPAMTQQGIILGTAAYMAPEQARGRTVDKRADVWAFGCVLYEMLTGRSTFGGETVTDVLAAVVTKEPDWTLLPVNTPRSLRTLLKRCLEKDPKNRLHDIADARIELDSPEPEPQTAPVAQARSSRWPVIAAVVAALAIGSAAGYAWRMSQEKIPDEWIGSRLGGPAVAFFPRLSPDGHLLAFIGLSDRQTQVVMSKPGTGNWTVLTHDRTRGLVNALSWSADSSLIYYDRFTDAAIGVFSVPNLGGDERLVIENAEAPLGLPDGSLLFGRRNADRVWQLHRLWPSTGKVEPLPFVRASQRLSYYQLQAVVDADRIAIVGRPQEDTSGADRLYLLDLSSHKATQIGSELDIEGITSVAVDPRDASVLVSVGEGNTYKVWKIRTDDSRTAETVMSFVMIPDIDVGRDGTLFVSLRERPYNVLRFTEAGTGLQTLGAGPTLRSSNAVALPDGRVLSSARTGDRSRVLILAEGREPVNLVQTEDETRAPYTTVGQDRVALAIGTNREIGVVSYASGRLVSRFRVPAEITALAASPDGQTLYFSANGRVSAVPVSGGTPREIGSGDSMVVDPDTGDLIVKLDEVSGFRLARIPARGGAAVPVSIRSSELRLITEPLTPGSIRHGRLVLPVGTVDSWYWYPAVLDLRTGDIKRVPLQYDTDFHFTTWGADGRIIGGGLGTRAGLWKFERKAR